ncbi:MULTISPECIES: PP2C family serine/threonine-protein phosphatase [Bacillus]|uniref:PP2C family serine/threonine-protein phosphatase n=1 Tax=Bacillus TaxID=1386 RepID=UPI0002DC4A68|nr:MULTISPECIES: PP2C family serine/threonine-protein phosphatase [Bacillus]
MIEDYIKNEKLELSIKQVAKNDAPFCGDSYFYIIEEDYFICVLADGLGSGEFAYESSQSVIDVVKEYHQLELETLLDKCNRVLINKRGAAVAILKVYFNKQQFQYISVGNIRFFLLQPSSDKLIFPPPTSGFLSGRAMKFQCKTFQYEPFSQFILYSDGLELKEIKTYLNRRNSIKQITNVIWNANVGQSDDTTLLMGSLFQ